MDGGKFDQFTRAFGAGRSRRGMIKSLAAGAVAALTAAAGLNDAAAAKLRSAGNSCTANSDCASGLCVQEGRTRKICQCGTDNDCPAGFGCVNGGCVSLGKPDGAACLQNVDCVSRHCAGDVCCDTACAGDCLTCATGTCANLAAETPCSGGVCNASGTCVGCLSGTECTSGFCSNSVCCAVADTDCALLAVCNQTTSGCVSGCILTEEGTAVCASGFGVGSGCATCSSESDCGSGLVCFRAGVLYGFSNFYPSTFSCSPPAFCSIVIADQ